MEIFEREKPSIMPARRDDARPRRLAGMPRDEGPPTSAPPSGVVMVTALQDWMNKRQALETGADDFVEKPFELASTCESGRGKRSKARPHDLTLAQLPHSCSERDTTRSLQSQAVSTLSDKAFRKRGELVTSTSTSTAKTQKSGDLRMGEAGEILETTIKA